MTPISPLQALATTNAKLLTYVFDGTNYWDPSQLQAGETAPWLVTPTPPPIQPDGPPLQVVPTADTVNATAIPATATATAATSSSSWLTWGLLAVAGWLLFRHFRKNL